MLADATMAEFVHLADQTIQEVTVVTHYNQRAVEIQQRLLQYILRLEIQVVGRLIENQQIHRFQQQLQDSQTGPFSTRQNLYLLGRILATKHECTQQIANLISDFALGNIIYRLEKRKLAIEQSRLILSKLANLNIVS